MGSLTFLQLWTSLTVIEIYLSLYIDLFYEQYAIIPILERKVNTGTVGKARNTLKKRQKCTARIYKEEEKRQGMNNQSN